MKNLLKISMLSLGFTAAASTLAADLCNVTYQAQNSWGSGAQQHVTVTNNGPALNGWKLGWTFTGSESVLSFWNASSVTQSGANVTATNGGSVPTGGQFSFDMIISNPGSTPADFFLNGISCKSPTTGTSTSSSSVRSSIESSSSSIKSSSSVKSSSSSIASSIPAGAASWTLDGANSILNFVTDKVKKDNLGEIGEVQSFTELKATIDTNGLAVLSIDLNTVKTNNDVRDTRIKDNLFETNLLPTLYYKVQLNLADINAIAVGGSAIQTLNGVLTLHGVNTNAPAQVLITKPKAGNLIVSSYKPLLISAPAYDLDGGIEGLRSVMDLLTITKVVPVYFNLNLVSNNSSAVTAINVPASPVAPMVLNSNLNTSTRVATLSWPDLSNNETGFLVRTRDGRGYWTKADLLPTNQTTFEDILMVEGKYDYKVIALNGSVPSSPSPVTTVSVGPIVEPPPPADGHKIYVEQCSVCHGADGKGGVVKVPLTTAKDFETVAKYIQTNMPQNAPGTCNADCARAVAGYISQTFWVATQPTLSCTADKPAFGARQLKLLTKSEYQNTVKDLLGVDHDVASGLSPDAIVVHFTNNTQLSVSPSSYDKYLAVAEDIASWSAGRNFSGVINCNNNFDNNCANTLISQFAPKVFRRPLDTTEKSTYTAMANGSKTNGNVKDGIQLAIKALLSSPQFLYRHEIGELNSALGSGAYELTPYEMATWLAYNFTGTTPDATLIQKAAANQLNTPDAIKIEAQRLLNLSSSSLAKAKFGEFVGSWLGTDELENATKDETVWPGFAALIPYMKQEVREDFTSVVLNSSEKFGSIYNANYTYINGPLAQHYGINGVSGDALTKVTTTNRGGILANGAFMSRWAEPVETSPIRRGVRVRERMLCQQIPEIPPGIFADRDRLLAENAAYLALPTTTNRDKYHTLTKNTPCSNCHEYQINPLGFGMEDFSSVGRVRATDLRGNVINAVGTLFAPVAWTNTSDASSAFVGTKQLGDVMANSSVAQYCFTQNIFRNAVGVGVEGVSKDAGAPLMSDEEKNGYACDVQTLTKTMMDNSPRTMLENLGAMNSIRYRKAWARQ
jgi:polyisoprenoid-binding protein YceI/cytochrome c553